MSYPDTTHLEIAQRQQVLQQAASAWMDGESLPDGVSEDALLQWLTHAEGSIAWQAWHTASDVLQDGGAFEDKAPYFSTQGVGSAAWTAQLQQRLRVTTVASLQDSVVDDSLGLQQHPRVAPVVAQPQQAAANSPWWRWAAGFASMAMVGVVSWAMWDVVPNAVTEPAYGVQALMATSATPVTPPAGAGAGMQDLVVAHAQIAGDDNMMDDYE